MKDAVNFMLVVGLIAASYFVIDALTTKSPNRRKTDLQDLRILGAGMNVIKSL